MNLLTGFCFIILIYLIFKFLYKPYSKNLQAKKLQKKLHEERFKQQLLNYHPWFIDLYHKFKLDQEEKRKTGFYSELMISEGGYITKIYGESLFVYDEYFEKYFKAQFDAKYCELINNPHELKKVKELIPQHFHRTKD
jgi:hypothetical protein